MGGKLACLIIVSAAMGGMAYAQTPTDQDQVAAQRWAELQRAIFPGRTLNQGEGVELLKIQHPGRRDKVGKFGVVDRPPYGRRF